MRYDAFYVQDQWTRGRLTLQGGAALRARVELVPRTARTASSRPTQFGPPIPVPEDRRRDGLQRHHAAHGRRLRRVRQRQDLAQGELQQVSAGRPTTRASTRRPIPAVSLRSRRTEPQLDRRRTATTWPTATCMNSEPANGECGPWANLNFGKPRQHDDGQPGRAAKAGASRPYDWQFGVVGAAGARCRASRWTSATTAGGGATSSSPTTARSAPQRLRHGRRSRRRAIRDLPDGGGYPVTFFTRQREATVRRRRQLLHVRQGLRRRDLLLARPGLQRERAHDERPDVPGRRDHRPRHPRLLRGAGDAAGADVDGRLRHRHLAGRACAVNESWQTNVRGLATLHDPEDRRAGERASVRSIATTRSRRRRTRWRPTARRSTPNYDVTCAILAAIGRAARAGPPPRPSTQTCRASVRLRINSVDLRFAKILRFGDADQRGIDLYNLFNANTGTRSTRRPPSGPTGRRRLPPDGGHEPALRALQRDDGLLIHGGHEGHDGGIVDLRHF